MGCKKVDFANEEALGRDFPFRMSGVSAGDSQFDCGGWSTECMGSLLRHLQPLDTGHWWSDFGAYAAGAYWRYPVWKWRKSRLPVKTPVAPVLLGSRLRIWKNWRKQWPITGYGQPVSAFRKIPCRRTSGLYYDQSFSRGSAAIFKLPDSHT